MPFFVCVYVILNQINNQRNQRMKSEISSSTKPNSTIDQVTELKNEIATLKNVVFQQNSSIVDQKSLKQHFHSKFEISEKKRRNYQTTIKLLIDQLKKNNIKIKKQWQLEEENIPDTLPTDLMVSSKHNPAKSPNEFRSNNYQRMDSKISLEAEVNQDTSKQKNTITHYRRERSNPKNDLVMKFLTKKRSNQFKSPQSVLSRNKDYNPPTGNSNNANNIKQSPLLALKSLKCIKSVNEIPKKTTYFDKKNEYELPFTKSNN